jgi:HSP20 family protein
MEAMMNLKSLAPFRSRTNPAPYDVNVFGTLHREIDRLFDDLTNGFGRLGGQDAASLVPSIDVTESDKEIVITAELPGLERKDVEISLENDVLTIRGEKKMEAAKDDKNNKNNNVHMAERSYGVFYRVLQLPPGVEPSSVQATMSKGVLKITIPKPARSAAKKIEVKEAA